MDDTTTSDITESRRAEEALRRSENQLRLALEAAEMGTFVWYPQEDRTEHDARLLALLGHREGDKITFAETLATMIHPEDREFCAAAVARAIDPSGDGKLDVDYRIVHPDGSLRWLHIYGQSSFDSENPTRAEAMYGIVFDITLRKRAEANLAFLADVSNDLVRLTTIDASMNALGAKIAGHFRASMCSFLEIDAERAIGTVLHEWHAEDAVSLIGEYWLPDYGTEEQLATWRSGEPFVVRDAGSDERVNSEALAAYGIASYISIPIARDGEWRYLLTVYGRGARDWTEGDIDLMLELTSRIWTRLERARAEEALRESRERLGLALDAAEIGTFLWYPQEDRTEMDVRALRVLGLGEGETMTLASALAEAIYPDDRELYAAAVTAAIDPKRDYKLDLDYRIVHPDRSVHWLHIYGKTYYSGGHSPQPALMYGMILDITERKRTEANLAFLAEVSADLVRLTNIGETMDVLGAKIGEHFRATRLGFFEFNEAADAAVCEYDWHAREDEASLVGEYHTADFYTDADEFVRTMRAGEAFVVGDGKADGRVMPQNLEALGIRSLIVVPADRHTRLVTLAINDNKPREWHPDEIDLIREVTTRIWTRLERARTEERLRLSEAQLQVLLDETPMGVYLIDADFRIIGVNPTARPVFGDIPDLIGRDFDEVIHRLWSNEDADEVVRLFRHTLETGEPYYVPERIGERQDLGKTEYYEWHINRIPLPDGRDGVVCYFRDISAEVLARRALAASEEKYRTLFDSIDEAFCTIELIFDDKGKAIDYLVLETNPAFVRQSGLEDAVGKTMRQIAPAHEEFWYETYGHIAQTGEPKRFQHAAAALGKIFDVYAFRIGEPAENRVAVVFTDITERKVAEDALRGSEEQYRTLFTSIDQGFCTIEVIFDKRGKAADYRFLETNPAFVRQTGLENAVGKMMREIAPAHEEFWFETYGKIAKTGEAARFENEAAALGRFYDVYAFRIGEPAENKVAILFNDISERKRAEEAVRESEERLRLLIESASDYAIFTMSPDSLITSWNAGAEKVFGWTEAEVLGGSTAIIFTPEDREKGALEQEMEIALRDGRAPDERFHLRKDGSRFYASGVMTLLRKDGRAQGFVKICRDMTEEIKAEKAVRDKEMLQKLVGAQEDERSRIARDLHDELGQQLTGLRLKLDAAKRMCNDEAVCDKIDEIEMLAKSIDNGVDFLAWELRPAALDDLGLIAALDRYVRQWSHHSGVKAELISSTLKKARFRPEVETHLYRIAQEALNNARKHARATSAEVVLERRDGWIALLIEDNGKGFDPKDKKNHLEGMGLIGMKERAHLIGGTLEIESAPGRGTTIFVRVPAEDVKGGTPDGR